MTTGLRLPAISEETTNSVKGKRVGPLSSLVGEWKERANKRRRVRFTDDDATRATESSCGQKPTRTSSSECSDGMKSVGGEDSVPADAAKHASFNLRQAGSICCHLKEGLGSSAQDWQNKCLGYLETPDLFKLFFYDGGPRTPAAIRAHNPLDDGTISLRELIQDLSMSKQLELAHKLATAVLQYHSTPWLADDWDVRDLSVFGSRQPGVEPALQDFRTLHVSAQFSEGTTAPIQAMEGIESHHGPTRLATTEDVQILYGIGNMSLASLGLALLGIGYRKDVRSLGSDTDPHQVVTARKLVAGLHTSMGPRYQNIVRRCLGCDFGFGGDLSRAELQSAVYSDVVCPLEDMIKGFESLSVI